MKCTFACKKVSLNDSIKEYTEKKVSKLDRYFQEEPAAFVTFSVEKNHLCTVELTIRGGNTIFRAQTQETDGDMRSAVDAAISYIERQILKNKTRLAKRMRSEAFPAPAELDDFTAYFDGVQAQRSLQANFRTDVWPEPGDRVLTLSTCFRGDNHQRYLVQGKLVAEAHAK